MNVWFVSASNDTDAVWPICTFAASVSENAAFTWSELRLTRVMNPVVPPLATASPTAPFTALTVPAAGATSVVSSTPFCAVDTAT